MRRLALAVLFLLAAAGARAQTGFTAVSAQVLDPSGNLYAGCHGNASYVPSPSATQVPTVNGSTFQTSVVIASCDSNANFTIIVADNNYVVDGHTSAPASQWRFGITSQDGKTAFSCTMTITGTTQNITGPLQACAAPLPIVTPSATGFIPITTQQSSTPSFISTGNTAFTFVLNQNVTSSTFATTPPTGTTPVFQFNICQDSAGGHSMTWPANVTLPTGYTFSTTANACSPVAFVYNPNTHAWTPWQNGGSGGGGGGGMIYPSGSGIPQVSGGASWGSTLGVQGTDVNVLTSGTVAANSPSGCTDSNGGFTTVGCSSGGLVSPVTTPNPVIFQVETELKGPNPYTDIRTFGARSTNSIPSGITAATNNGSANVTLSGASSFVNGDGVVIYNAGAANNVSTPSAPTVTNVMANGGTGTGLVTPSAIGSNTVCYKVSAMDAAGGYSVASAETCTTTGQTIGLQTVNITSLSRSGNVVTVNTSASHNFLVGCSVCGEVLIPTGNGLTDVSFAGWHLVTSATDSTHFTFNNPTQSTVNGAATSATGGIAKMFAANHLAITPVANTWMYLIYAGATNAEVLYGVSRPQGTVATDPTFDDFGATMMGHTPFPSWVPTTPPVSAGNDQLSTTIVSGAGTTNIVTADTAGATGTNPVTVDSCPAFKAAATYSAASGTIWIPGSPVSTYFWLTSVCDMRAYNGISWSQSGSLRMATGASLLLPVTRWSGMSLSSSPGISQLWGNYPFIAVDGALGMYVSNFANTSIKGVNFLSSGGNLNNQILLFGDNPSGFSSEIENAAFSTGTSTNDKMGIGLYLRGTSGQSIASLTMDKVYFVSGSTAEDSHNAGFFCNLCGDVHIRAGYTVHRGILFEAVPVGGQLQIDQYHYDGGGTPLVTVVGAPPVAVSLGVAGNGEVIMDTIEPCLAALNAGSNLTVSGCYPSSGVQIATGNVQWIQPNANANAMTGSAFNNPAYGTESVSETAARSNSAYGVTNIVDSLDYWLVSNASQAAPTCAVSAGGSLNVATYTFKIVPQWWNGKEGQPSPASLPCSTTGGNQTITINWSLGTGTPQSYYLYWSNGGGYAASNTFSPGNPIPASATSATWSSNGAALRVLGGVYLGGPTTIGAAAISAQSLILPATTAPTGQTGATIHYTDATSLWPSFKPNGNTAYLFAGFSGTWAATQCAVASSTPYVFNLQVCSGGGGGGTVSTTGTPANYQLPVFSGPTAITNVVDGTAGYPLLFVSTSAIPAYGQLPLATAVTGTLANARLVNSGVSTVNGQSCSPGATCTIPIQTNSNGGNTSQAGINLLTSTVNSVGLTVTPVNSATNAEKFEITGSSYLGQAATAGALGATPTQCSGGTPVATGIAANGNANCTSAGTITLPQTIAGTVNSGGVPYFSNATTMGSSAALPSGNFVLGGGAGNPPTATFSVVPPANGATGVANPTAHSLGVAEGGSNWTFITGTAGLCLLFNGVGADPAAATCPGNNFLGTQYGVPYALTTTTLGSLTPPTSNGLYSVVYNVTGGVALPPTVLQSGLSGRAIIGAASTDTVLYSDSLNVIDHDSAGSASVNETIPTATTLGNANFGYSYSNHSSHTDTITPTTWTINGAATLSVPAGNFVRVKVDPNSSTNWLADVSASSLTSGVTNVSGDGTLITNSSSTAAVTLTLGTAGSYNVWGRNAGTTGAPGYSALTCGFLPALTGDTTTSAGTCGTTTTKINGTTFSGTVNDLVGFGSGGTIPFDTGILYTNVLTAASALTSGNLVQAAASTRATSDSGIATANVVTAASNYTSGNLVQGAGANKTTSDSGVAVSNLGLLNGTQSFTAPNTFTGTLTNSKNAASSAPSITFSGTTFSGTGTTATPLFLIGSGSAASSWNTAGTYLGFNTAGSYTGNIWDVHVNGGASLAKLDYQGNITVASCTGCGSGTGTVTVVSSGNLTSTALVTGGGSQALQTPSATSTLSAAGNMSLAGTLAVTGHVTLEGVTSTGAQGTGALVFSGTPTLTTPVIGAATGTSLNVSGTLTSGTNGGTGGSLTLNGSTTGSCAITVAATGGTPSLCGTSVTPGNLVFASSPGAGIAHFAGSTQTATSSAIVDADVSFTTPALGAPTATTQSADNNSTTVATTAYVDRTVTRSIGWSFGDVATGSALTTSEVGYVTVPFACTIKGWHIMADAGTTTVKVWRVNGGTALPTVSNSINTSGVALSAGTKVDSTTVTDFTSTAIAANDTLGFSLFAVATAKQITFSLDCAQ
jgi:hypothetical protein